MRDDETPEPTDNRWSPPTATDGVLRLTYDQIGKRLGMTADAARQLARRKGWPRTRPNAIGEPVVVSVPASELPSEHPSVHRRATDGEPLDNRRATGSGPSVTGGAGPPSVDRRSDLHAQALAALEDALTAANTRAVEAMALADRLAGQLADASARADSEITTLRNAVDGLRSTLSRAETRAVHAEQRATEAEARAAAKDARTEEAEAEATELRLVADQARARAAEVQQVAEAQVAQSQAEAARARGVAQEAVQAAETLRTAMEEARRAAEARAEQAERGLSAERSRAEALRASVDELRAGQALMADMHAQELAAAQEAVEDLRQAETARKGRGRWARLRAAWRGE